MELGNKTLFIIFFLLLFIVMCGNKVVEGLKNEDKSNNEHEGISKHQIPKGDEDLYILKSQVVPPVCPACPESINIPREKAPPPCPPCARCPEPAFDCKKVPNYNSTQEQYLPKPMLTNFSNF